MLFFQPEKNDPRLEHQFEVAYLQECIERDRSGIAFSDFGEDTRKLYWQLLKHDPRVAERICPEASAQFCAAHNNDMETHRALREAVTLHARNAFEKMEYRPTVLHFLFDRRGRLLFVKSQKAVLKGAENWNLVQGGVHKGEDILSASRREVCIEECPSIAVSDLADYRFLGGKDMECANGRGLRGGFTAGKRYIAVSVEYSGHPALETNREEIAQYQWVPPQDIRKFLATMREKKQEFLREKLALIAQRRRGLRISLAA